MGPSENEAAARLVALLTEIRDNQRLQIERQAEALAMQREQFALVQKQHERAERLQDRAEAIQASSGELIAKSRKVLRIALPLVLLLLIILFAYVGWMILRRY